MAQPAAIRDVLTTCGFDTTRERNLIIENEGFDRWIVLYFDRF